MIIRSLLSQRLIPRSASVTGVATSTVFSSFSHQRWQRGVVGLDGTLCSPPRRCYTNTPSSRRESFHSLDPSVSRHGDDLKSDWLLNPDLASHIRASLSLVENVEKEIDTGFEVCFLGTGAGQLSIFRGNSATALRMGSTTYLFDAGEGLQRQLMISALNAGDIRKIFITHLHTDHIGGLPGLLLGLQLIAKTSKQAKKKTLQIYGPVGLYNYIATSLSLSFAELKHLTVQVFELTGGSNRWQHPGALRTFPEFRHRGLQRKSIPMNPDGTWTLEEAVEVTTPEEAVEYSSRPMGTYIQAAEVHHVPKLQCYGYVVREPIQPRSIDPDRAKNLGVRPGAKYKMLKSGFNVQSDDGLREVLADDVVGDPVKQRKFALIGDCCGISRPMVGLCHDADVLVHEATLSEGDSEEKIQRGGHSTPTMAGAFAGYVNAKVLALNHISSQGGGKFVPTMRTLIRNAEDAAGASTRVQLSYDLMEIVVPRGGFDFTEKVETKIDRQEEAAQAGPQVDSSTKENCEQNLA
jgi:ribonuclease Z